MRLTRSDSCRPCSLRLVQTECDQHNQHRPPTVAQVWCYPAYRSLYNQRRFELSTQNNNPIFTFNLNDQGSQIFSQITSNNVGKPLCILIDDNLIFPGDTNMSCPTINAAITTGQAQISGPGVTATWPSNLPNVSMPAPWPRR